MKEEKAIQRQSNEIMISSDGRTHQVKAQGDVAKGIAAAASAAAGFAIGFLLMLLG